MIQDKLYERELTPALKTEIRSLVQNLQVVNEYLDLMLANDCQDLAK